jgi:Skp family chaperone for outer membrane proteins
VSTTPQSPNALEAPPTGKNSNRRIDEAFEEVARLSGSDVPPTDFYQQFLAKVVAGIEAPAGAVWLRTPQGFLQLQCQMNLDGVGLDKHKGGRQSHNELLRQAFQMAKPMLLEPYGTTGIHEGMPAGNPTDFVVLLAPIQVAKQGEKQPEGMETIGLVEVWQDPRWDARAQKLCLNYVIQMAGYAANFARNQQGRRLAGQEQVWSQLEGFAREVHASLDPTRVAYQVANEGRRIIACDRLSVATVEAKKCKIQAVSGSDVVEKRSNLIVLMRALVDSVLAWGEKLVYAGTKDDSLPPDVLVALDDFLSESNSKLLVLQPLRDERQKDKPGPARAALLMECFETPEATEPLISRLEVVSRHATSALYNAVELNRIPLGWVWKPMAAVQAGLGGKTKAIIAAIVVAVLGIAVAMVLVPYPLKMDANGQLLPVDLRQIYAPHPGHVREFLVDPDKRFQAGQSLVTLEDSELAQKMLMLKEQIKSSADSLNQLRLQEREAKDQTQRNNTRRKIAETEADFNAKVQERQELIRINNIINTDPNHLGLFQVVAPAFSTKRVAKHFPEWTILDPDYREKFTNQYVKPSDAILRLGDVNGPFEVELKIPEKHIGQVMRAFPKDQADPRLDVDLLVMSDPTKKYRGVLFKSRVAGEAVPSRDDHNESAPFVIAYVSLDDQSIPEELRIPRDYITTGVEVHAKILCGNHALGYSLFYGLWEFMYEKVVFFF